MSRRHSNRSKICCERLKKVNIKIHQKYVWPKTTRFFDSQQKLKISAYTPMIQTSCFQQLLCNLPHLPFSCKTHPPSQICLYACEPRESRGAEQSGAFCEAKFESLLCEPRESRGGLRPFPEGKFESLPCEPRESRGAEQSGAFCEAKFENPPCEPPQTSNAQRNNPLVTQNYNVISFHFIFLHSSEQSQTKFSNPSSHSTKLCPQQNSNKIIPSKNSRQISKSPSKKNHYNII